MAYKVTWEGKAGSKFSFTSPDNEKEKIILKAGESREFAAMPKIGKLAGLYLEDLEETERLAKEAKASEDKEDASASEDKEEAPKKEKSSKSKKKGRKKGSMGNSKIG